MCTLLLQVESKGAKLHRKKRYVAFPEGASFSAVYCLTFQMGITDGARIFTEGINWGLVYDLPNDTKPFIDGYGPALKRRNRRELYTKVEDILNSYPKEPVASNEPDDHRLYHWAAHMASSPDNDDDVDCAKECSDIFYCPFSLIDLALGHYSRFDEPTDNSIDPS
ncbi:hypothetical protein D910_02255 [Dendroctonus ponderosae]|uniref:Uncharacterized protein n=1 Tax=Dendroctonus ponderosae TaxID=77166 RepID=U4U2N4_DENPD|nr:hypothetical protein D910_02255 [Dendroctonus ponderosae]